MLSYANGHNTVNMGSLGPEERFMTEDLENRMREILNEIKCDAF